MSSGKEFSGSLCVKAGSDHVFTHECDSCRFDGSLSEGIAFCVVCEEYLCSTCVSVHKKNKATRKHTVLEGQDIPAAARYVGSDSDVDYCDIHKVKELKYFCKDHDQLLCDVCKAVDHVLCKNMVDIQDVVTGAHWTNKAESEIAEMQKLIRVFKTIQSDGQAGYDDFKKQKERCCKELRELRVKLNNTLDKLERDMFDKLDKADTERKSSLSHQLTVAEDSITSLDKSATAIQSARKAGNEGKIFISANRVSSTKLTAAAVKLAAQNRKVIMKVEVEPALLNIINDIKQLGQLTITTCYRTVLRDRTALETGEFSVREQSDTYTCYITSAHFLEDGRLVVADYCNRKVKILEGTLTLQSSVKLPSDPTDISLINQQDAVVTLPKISKLQFVRLSPRLELIRQVKTRLQCKGIVCHNSKLYVSCQEMGTLAVLVLNLLGQEETIIRTDVKCYLPTYVMGQYPNYIAADTRGYLYISDWRTHMVLCITLKGGVVYKYTHSTLQRPMSLLLDTDNNVLVCGIESNNVQVIIDTGTYHRDIIPPREGDVHRPRSIAYKGIDNTLVVGMADSDTMIVFRLV